MPILVTAIKNVNSSSPWSSLSSSNHLCLVHVFSIFFLLLTVFRLFLFILLTLLGVCDQNHANDFTLRNGSVTSDSGVFIQDWTLKEPGKICEVRREDQCSEHAARRCHLLLSDQFAECHRITPPNTFYESCEENSCYEDEVCEMIATYAHICRENGICIDWRTPEFCRKEFTIQYNRYINCLTQ